VAGFGRLAQVARQTVNELGHVFNITDNVRLSKWNDPQENSAGVLMIQNKRGEIMISWFLFGTMYS
jgi:hypothetical protein